jgi:large repetitive protein
MRLKLALLVVFAVSLLSYTASAAGEYYFVKTWGSQGLVKTGAFTFPQHVAVDAAGNVYVTDLGNSRVQKFDSEGVFLHSWGSKGTRSSEFHSPAGIAVSGDYVYVVDHELAAVKKFDTNGKFVTSWGSAGSEPGKLKLPNGIAVSGNQVYVADTANSRVQKFDSEGKFISVIGSSGTGDGQFLTPLGVALDSDGNLYVADYGNKRIQKFSSDGSFAKSFSPTVGGLKISPDGLTIDSSGNIIIADITNNRVVILDANGNTVSTFGKTGTGNGQFNMLKDVSVGSNGSLFAVDSSNHRIQKFSMNTQQVQTTQTPLPQTQTTQTTQNTQTVTNDFKKPTIVPPKDVYAEATGGLTVVSIGQATATDESGIKSLTNNAPEQFPLGTTTVIWTAIDNAGNVGIATQIVTIVDTTPPVISGLSDITIESQGLQNTVNLGNPETFDQVGVMSIVNDAPPYFALGETKVTWTATDVAKNTATFVQTVTVTDTKPPRITLPADVTMEATSLDKNSVSLGEPRVTDSSEIVSLTNDAPEFFAVGETIVTWTAIDAAGNVADAKQKVTILDTEPPVIEPQEEVVFEAVSSSGSALTLTPPAVSDIQEASITNDAPELFPVGTTTITWLATDMSGNNSTMTQKITVVDTTAPTITPPDDIEQEATGMMGNIVSLGEPVVEDVSKIASITNDAPEEFPFGITIVTWTATDEYGNFASANQTITIIDTTKPTITPPKDVVFEATSMAENIVMLGEPKVSDLVGIESVTNDAPEFFPLGQTRITWTATDTSGNSEIAYQMVSVVDTTAPTIVVSDDMIVEADGPSGTNVVISNANVADAIGVDSVTNDAPELFSLGLTQITWTATDISGNTATMVQNVTVVDTTAPAITPPEDITVEATSASDNVISLLPPVATDAVSAVSLTNDAPATFALGETIVTWTATDEAGNTSTATQKVTIVDTTAPAITPPEDVTVEAVSKSENLVDLAVPEVSDNVEVASITNDAPEVFPVGKTIVTWTATDISGNVSEYAQTVNVVDTTQPVIAVKDIKIEATSELDNPVDLGSVKVTDQVEVASITNDAPDKFALGVTVITWTATDTSGNVATVTQKITIVDTKAPVIETPSDITVEATSASDNVISLLPPVATDAVSAVSLTNDAPATFALGETIVTWTATDEAGNTSTATQKVTIVDTTAPAITPPEDVTVEAVSKSENLVDLAVPEVSDNVEVASITNDAPEVFPVGKTIVTWTATDISGNVSEYAQTVNVVDTIAPKFARTVPITVEASSLAENQIELVAPQVTDIQAIISLTNDAPATFALGETIVTWTATDEAGNTSTATQKVTIVDTTAPAITPPEDVTVEATSASDNIVSLGSAKATDLVSIDSITNDAPEVFPVGETIVIWTATDTSGNVATAAQKITVIDTTAPAITPPEDITVEATSASDNVISLLPPVATDAVSAVSLTNDAPATFALGETIVTWTATDEAGNTSTATQKIILVDTTAPELAIPDNVIINAVSLMSPVTIGSASASDHTDSSVKITHDAPALFKLGETIITWTAEDKFGNKVTKAQTITVEACGKPESAYNVILGTESDDILYGTRNADLIIGFEGNNIIYGDRGDDCILVGDGDNVIYGGDGNDYIHVGNGNNVIMGQSGNDTIIGGEGYNIIDGGEGRDTCIVKEDNDGVVVNCEL